MTSEQGLTLLRLARAGVHAAVGGPEVRIPREDWLQAPGASFVTLMREGALRGCIGTLEAWRPLAEDVVENARACALRDPRFEPLTAEEYESVDIEVSLLSSSEPLLFGDEEELYERLRPGVDGVILSAGPRRATFLPQVWEQLPDPMEFMAQLQRKAGLQDLPLRACTVRRYTVRKWREADFAAAGTKS